MLRQRSAEQASSNPFRVQGLPTVWKPGEHIAVVGDTGSGKTYLVAKIAALRKYVVMIRTKPDDIQFPSFDLFQSADAMERWNAERILLVPKLHRQAREVKSALQNTWEHGSWTTIVDELWYAERRLGLSKDVENLLTQGRSKKISMIVGMQRPSQVSRFAIAECTHLFCFRLEGRDAKTVAEASSPRMHPLILGLQGHDFAYYNRSLRVAAIGNANDLGGVFSNPVLPRMPRAEYE